MKKFQVEIKHIVEVTYEALIEAKYAWEAKEKIQKQIDNGILFDKALSDVEPIDKQGLELFIDDVVEK